MPQVRKTDRQTDRQTVGQRQIERKRAHKHCLKARHKRFCFFLLQIYVFLDYFSNKHNCPMGVMIVLTSSQWRHLEWWNRIKIRAKFHLHDCRWRHMRSQQSQHCCPLFGRQRSSFSLILSFKLSRKKGQKKEREKERKKSPLTKLGQSEARVRAASVQRKREIGFKAKSWASECNSCEMS